MALCCPRCLWCAGEEIRCSPAAGGAASGTPISGDLGYIRRCALQSNALLLVVVEKDAIFQVSGAASAAAWLQAALSLAFCACSVSSHCSPLLPTAAHD